MIEYIRGDVLHNENNGHRIIIENNEDNYIIFVLNGFYMAKTDKKGNIINFFVEENKDKLPFTDKEKEISILRGFNLKFENKVMSISNIFKDTNLIGNLNKNKKLKKELSNYFNENNKRFGDSISDYHNKIKNMIMYSKCFDFFYESKFKIGDKYKVGDIFIDNLQKSDFYKDKNTKLNNNYWVVYKKTSYGFFAMNLETMSIFHFLNDGKVDLFVNDIDNRWSHKTGNYTMRTNALNEISTVALNLKEENEENGKIVMGEITTGSVFYEDEEKVTYYDFYNREKITDNHFFNGLRLVEKIKLDKEDISYIMNVISYQIKKKEYDYNFCINSINRNISSSIERIFDEKKNPNSRYSFSSGGFDGNVNLEKNYHIFYDYERYIVDQYVEKFYMLHDILKTIVGIEGRNKFEKDFKSEIEELNLLNITFIKKLMEDRLPSIRKEEERKLYFDSLNEYNKKFNFDDNTVEKINNHYLFVLNNLDVLKERNLKIQLDYKEKIKKSKKSA